MPHATPSAAPTLRAWLCLDRALPQRFSLRFEVSGGIGRLSPSPPHAPAGLSRGRPVGLVENLDLHELYIIEILTAAGPGRAWERWPLLSDGAAVLSDLEVGVWVELVLGGASRHGPVAAAPELQVAGVEGVALDADDLPTEARGLLAFPSLDDEPLPPLDDDAPTDLSLLPPPMARLYALRRHRDLETQT